jgi:hypothetical protein
MTETPAHCWKCATPLDDDAGYERDNDLWCNECYDEEYEFPCAWCEEYGDVDDQHAYLLVVDEKEAGLDVPGVYRVTGVPYYTSPLIGRGWFFRSNLRYLGPLPSTFSVEGQWYPCGHVCLACQRRLLVELVQRGYSLDVY